jgi:hypothetical protein
MIVDWIAGADGFRTRPYPDYESYLHHQSSKRTLIEESDFLNWYHPLLRFCLAQRLPENPHLKSGSSVLCLAARSGAEIEAFRDVGYHPIGIDLEPLGEGVIYSDFHFLPFGNRSFDVVFTNSIDHVFNVYKFLAQVRRVTASIFILELAKGGPQEYESFTWSSLRQIMILLVQEGFKIVRMSAYEEPWGGVQITSIP